MNKEVLPQVDSGLADESREEGSGASQCVEGRDYFIENGKWVFTAYFLRQRGYCCRTGCRHCPYPVEAECE